MHRTLIALVVICVFVLMTVPAMAADSDTVDATINVSTVWHVWDECGNFITFTINNGEYDNGYVYPSGDPSKIGAKSNQDYNIKIEYDVFTNSSPDTLPTGWHLWTREGDPVPNDHSLSYEIKDTADALYWTSNQGPTNGEFLYFWYMLDGFEYEDNWVGNHPMDIIYTMATSI